MPAAATAAAAARRRPHRRPRLPPSRLMPRWTAAAAAPAPPAALRADGRPRRSAEPHRHDPVGDGVRRRSAGVLTGAVQLTAGSLRDLNFPARWSRWPAVTVITCVSVVPSSSRSSWCSSRRSSRSARRRPGDAAETGQCVAPSTYRKGLADRIQVTVSTSTGTHSVKRKLAWRSTRCGCRTGTYGCSSRIQARRRHECPDQRQTVTVVRRTATRPSTCQAPRRGQGGSPKPPVAARIVA